MTVGANAGGQLNLFLFEVGMIRRDPAGLLPDVVLPVAIHPLLVAPTSIRYTDASRGQVEQTAQASVRGVAGRAMRRVQMQGTFGVESRGLLLYVGTGELRFQRFWHEVVRLADATSQAQVDAEKDILRSPLLELALKAYDEDNTTLYVNFYDFWFNVQMEIHPGTFSCERVHRRGAASGLTHYTFDFQEAGEIVTGGVSNALIRGLFEVLTGWTQLNDFVESYTLQAVLDGFAAAASIVTTQLRETWEAAQNQLVVQMPTVVGLLEGFTPPGQAATLEDGNAAALTDYLATADTMALLATDLADALSAAAPTQPTGASGAVSWSGAVGEGQNDAVEAVAAINTLHELAFATRFQRAAGGFYGMSREEFDEFLSSTGRSGRQASLSGTIEHTVTPWDTIERLETRYGVRFGDILTLNQMLASEALITGTKLLIPRERVVGSQSRIEGLPVFGSHAGRDAWGKDFYSDFRTDDAGGLAVLEGPEVLVQGVEWILDQEGEDLLKFANEVPVLPNGDARSVALRKRLAVMLRSDRRFVAVTQVDSILGEGGQSVDFDVTLVAINGETISTGRPG